MTSDLDTSSSRGDRARTRAYLREFLPATVTYVVVLVAVVARGGLDGDAPSRFVWAMLPLIPALAMVAAAWRHLRRQDEFQRLLILQGLSLGFGVMVVAAVTFGFLDMAGLVVPGTPWWVYGAGMAGWAVGSAVVSRRQGGEA